MRNVLWVIVISIFLPVSAQEEFQWKLVRTHVCGEVDAWDVDPMGKVIYARKDVIIKLDSSFAVLFRQSTKGTGNISEIDARHALKTLVFSEDQQSISFLDNTLTQTKNSKDLSVIGASYVTKVSYSAQSTRYWVFDGDNSKLFLIDETRNIPNVIENLSGLLGEINVELLMEVENMLVIFDSSKGIYLFDYYGSLIDFVALENASNVNYYKGELYYIVNNRLVNHDLRSRKMISVELPETDIRGFRILGDEVYIRTTDEIRKYLLKRL
jgi:hypothetical protein